MDAATVERLKAEWTGRRVEVASPAPTLRRFAGKAGTVVTVNMNGRALVRFDGLADIGWYDIAVGDLQPIAAAPPPEELAPKPPGEPPVTSATRPKAEAAVLSSDAPAEPAAKPPAARKKSILELAREQGAVKKKD
jgi:hypothetical protein